MNIILLMFIVLSAMFVSSSMNNILTVVSGVDYYLDKAGVGDYVVIDQNLTENDTTEEFLDSCDCIQSYTAEDILFIGNENFYKSGAKARNLKNNCLLTSVDRAKLNYFDENNDKIEKVEKGKIFIASTMVDELELKKGDKIEIRLDDFSKEYEMAGVCKDALFSSQLMGNKRILMSETDYEELSGGSGVFHGKIYNITSDDTKTLDTKISQADNIDFNCDRSLVKMSYVLDMIIAVILLVISVCLILIAFVVLKFTIGFTLSEEFREIGVMKAIGIKNRSIRALYMIKNLAISLFGAVIGFAAGIPFGSMMLKSVSGKMVLGHEGGILINIVSSLSVTAVVLLFCWICTGKIKKFTPLDAIRTGETGERFKKKRGLRLSKSRGNTSVFLALNDVLGKPARYFTLILAFTLCLCLVLVLNITADTLRSDSLVTSFSMTESDVYYTNASEQMNFFHSGGREEAEKRLDQYEKELADLGMPAEAHVEAWYHFTVEHGDQSIKSVCIQGIGGVTADRYTYLEGDAPQNEDEAAVTKLIADKLDVHIGDTITIKTMDGNVDLLVTGYFETMNNLGECIRLSEKFRTDFSQCGAMFEYQFDFTDNPDKAEVERRIEKLKEYFDSDKVMTAGQFCEMQTGVGSSMEGLKNLALIVTFIIIILITVLMERSFITKEHSEIALYKAIGFKDKSIIASQVWRFSIVGIVSCLLAMALSIPLTKLIDKNIFGMMGVKDVNYEVDALEIFLIYPAAVLAITVISAFFTALYTKTVKSADISNIE